jgi:Uma2 family endonuclease
MSIDTRVATNALAVLEPVKSPRLYKLFEYLRREEKAKSLNEYYDGIIKKLPMAKGPHNIIIINLATELHISFRSNTKNYTVFGSQQLVYLPELNFGLYPDVLAIADTPEYWDDNEVLLINPLLIVEVLSKSTRKYDRTNKFDEYKTLPSLMEYVLIDSDKCYVETRFKEEPNLWRDTIYTDISDSVVLKSVDCSVALQAIYDKITFKS